MVIRMWLDFCCYVVSRKSISMIHLMMIMIGRVEMRKREGERLLSSKRGEDYGRWTKECFGKYSGQRIKGLERDDNCFGTRCTSCKLWLLMIHVWYIRCMLCVPNVNFERRNRRWAKERPSHTRQTLLSCDRRTVMTTNMGYIIHEGRIFTGYGRRKEKKKARRQLHSLQQTSSSW